MLTKIQLRVNVGFVVLASFCLILLLGAGCQPGAGGAGGYPVSGVVRYQGKPVDGANVVFSPVDPQQGARAEAAKTDAQGRYSLKLVPGEYAVAVTKYSQPGAQPSEPAGEYTPPEEGAQTPVAKNELPEKYATASTSPLRLKLEPKETTFDIELTD